MNIILPMAGAGQRFHQAGYEQHKAILPMVYRKSGEECPMVVCAVKDLPGVEEGGENICFIMRDFHLSEGVDKVIRHWYPKARFIVTDHLTEGQACTCLLAKDSMDMEDGLLIAACDNGIEIDESDFNVERDIHDALFFTYKNNPIVEDDPDAFGWMMTDENSRVTGVSVKHRISDDPQNDHAIVGTFWFKKARYFVEAAEKMIREDDRVNGEFYVDQIVGHLLDLGYDTGIYETERFFNYGDPCGYENYNNMIGHFRSFIIRGRDFGLWDIG